MVGQLSEWWDKLFGTYVCIYRGQGSKGDHLFEYNPNPRDINIPPLCAPDEDDTNCLSQRSTIYILLIHGGYFQKKKKMIYSISEQG